MRVWDWVAKRLRWMRRLPVTIEICRERHERHLVIVTGTHPDGRPRDLRIIADDDVVDLAGDEQFASIYLRTEQLRGRMR